MTQKIKRLLIAWACVGACAAQGAPAAAPTDVALVRCTLAEARAPGQARGYALHRDAVARKLEECGIPFDTLADERVIAGELTRYKLAIFPYNSVSDPEEIRQILVFVERGGRLVWFYGFPQKLAPLLGIERHTQRGKAYDGEFFTMKFAQDRPAGFPAEVRQQSPNCRVVEKLAPEGRAIAFWHDKDGRCTGVPAAVLTPRSLYLSHVLWGDADASQQRALLLAALGHFLPGTWARVVGGAIERVARDAGYDGLDQLADAARDNPAAERRAAEAAARSRQAREALAAARYGDALGLAEQARAEAQKAATSLFAGRTHELRGAWVHPDDATDWETLMTELDAAGFNAVFPIMCGPDSAKYPSAHVAQSTQRDHMRECIDAARRHDIEVHVWKANWQVLSSGPAAARRRFADEGRFVLSLEQAEGGAEKSHYQWSTRWLDPSDERNRQLECDMMVELVEKYRPAGVHFDFMRYPEIGYCYCARCRDAFQRWAGVEVRHWPRDCAGQAILGPKYRDWRRHLQTSLVRRIAHAVRAADPNVKLSLAARASMTGSFESDAQDWVAWAKEGLLDFLCPMDYTGNVDVLRAKLEPQMAAAGGVVPIYAGLGVSPTRSATPVNLSRQIILARELGADGFLLFALSPFTRAMLPILKLGPTSVAPGRPLPHHAQPVRAVFEYPAGSDGAPARTYRAGGDLSIPVRLAVVGDKIKEFTARVSIARAGGGGVEIGTTETQATAGRAMLEMRLPSAPGIYVVVVRTEAVAHDGTRRACHQRSLPICLQPAPGAPAGGGR